jgi:peptidoglycan L-alanyl-D-glutamate endopeptidase CwlK
VTNAPAGSSFHNYGLAVDLVFDGDTTKSGWQWSWDSKFPWKALADLGVSFGLESAFYWLTFKESPHFQATYGMQHTELLALYQQGGLPEVWAELQKHV